MRVIDPSPLLRPEMLTRVKFLPEGGAERAGGGVREAEVARRVLAPEGALDERNGAARVWTVVDRRNGRGTLRSVPVEALERESGWVAIQGSVHAGALLALRTDGLSDGQRVAIAPAAASTAAAAPGEGGAR